MFVCCVSIRESRSLSSVYCPHSTGEDFNCRTGCFAIYDTSEDEYPLTSCDAIDEVLDCYSLNLNSCNSDFQIKLLLGKVYENLQALNCSTGNSNKTVISLKCPNVPDISDFNPSMIMSRPAIKPPADLPTLCTMPHSFTSLRQCSLFMDSQLRAFSNYRKGLETCSIPGKWYLLRHQMLTIEVEGMNLESGSDHTRLTKINVTFYAHSCNPVARSYVARVSSNLASEFIPPFVAPDNFTSAVTTTATRSSASSSSPLQLISNSNGSVVTLLATWLNTTIVIRQYASFLSITLQVPGEISYKSEGLCTGCPPHMYINITHFNNQIKSNCSDDETRALLSCFVNGGVVNQDNLVDVTNNTYLEACVYSMFKTKSAEVLSMIKAVAGDAMLLVNIGDSPTPQQPTNPHAFPLSSPTQTSSTHDDSSPESSSHFLFPSPLLILLSSLLLVRWHLV